MGNVVFASTDRFTPSDDKCLQWQERYTEFVHDPRWRSGCTGPTVNVNPLANAA